MIKILSLYKRNLVKTTFKKPIRVTIINPLFATRSRALRTRCYSCFATNASPEPFTGKVRPITGWSMHQPDDNPEICQGRRGQNEHEGLF